MHSEIAPSFTPHITIIVCLLSIVLFFGINLESSINTWDSYRKWGSPSLTDIYNGSYWGLITSNFLHKELWHIIFNIYWIWRFGRKIEQESSKSFYLLLILTACLISSCAQIGFSDNSGIGLSGVGYTFFGYLFIQFRIGSKKYEGVLNQKTINLFFIWLLLCMVLTKFNILQIGNSAHVFGLLWGTIIALTQSNEIRKKWGIRCLTLGLVVSSFLWNPFAVSWLSHQAYALHIDGKVDTAIPLYEKIISRSPHNEFAKENLKQLYVYNLQIKIYDGGLDRGETMEYLNKILDIDPKNEWALDYLNR